MGPADLRYRIWLIALQHGPRKTLLQLIPLHP